MGSRTFSQLTDFLHETVGRGFTACGEKCRVKICSIGKKGYLRPVLSEKGCYII